MGNNDMPWIGDNMKFPRVGDEGFDDFDFTPKQVEIINETTREETALDLASGIIRELSKLQMDSERDFLKAVRTVASQAI